MINVGVFPCGSEVSLEVSRSLKHSKDINLFGLGSVPDYGQVAFENNFSTLPFFTEPNFISSLNKIVKDHKIQFLIPGMDEVAHFLKLNEKEIGCEVVYASLETAEIIRRKSSTYAALDAYVPTPNIYDKDNLSALSDFPIFCKPDIGYGSRGARKIETSEQLSKVCKEDRGVNIYIEYLPGEELTVDCFSSNSSEVLFAGPRKRDRIRMGISVSTIPVELTSEIDSFASSISKKFSMIGCWFFQIKKSSTGEFKLMEVASRVSGSMSTYRLMGINFILLDIYQRLGYNVSVPKLSCHYTRLERAFDVKAVGYASFDSVYVDLDDCLILKGSVNADLISFLYGCRNKNIPIYLVTRHSLNLDETLTKYRISKLYDDIFHVTDGRPKSDFIIRNKSLFIDDSFVERQEVSETIGCDVASPDMVSMELLR